MKVIIVNDYARIDGGASKMAIMTAQGLAKRGYDVEFFAGMPGIGPELESMPQIKVTNLEALHHARDPNKLRGAMNGIWYRRAGHTMRSILGRCDRTDTILHFHGYRSSLTTSAAHAAMKMGFATVYTAHEYTLGCPYGGFFDARRNKICPLTGLSAACLITLCNKSNYINKLWYYMAELVYSKIARIPQRLSHIIFISQLNRKVLSKYLPERARTSLVSNAYDYFGADAATMDATSPFLFIGSLEPHKDPVTAAKAAHKLGAPIVFVGTGMLENEVLKAHPDAIVTGWLGREEVEGWLRRSRALIFPSIWYEGQPLTTMEAAGCGVPIIVGDDSAAVEQVEQLGIGEIFKGGDVNDLADKMRPYLDIEFAKKQGRLTQQSYLRLDISQERYIGRLLEIYRSELDRIQPSK